MNIRIVNLPEIAIIGKEGFCTEESNVVQELWKQANENFSEVQELGMKEKDGSYVGFWGAMSDETMSFLPWTMNYSRGYYLAGIETYQDAEAPEGWKKWILPARSYLVMEVTPEHYMDVFRDGLMHQLPARNKKLCGAVCDFTEPATGKNFLFFPVEDVR